MGFHNVWVKSLVPLIYWGLDCAKCVYGQQSGPERHLLRYKGSAEHPTGQTDLHPLTGVPASDAKGQHLSGLLQQSSTCVLAGPDGLEEQRFSPACHGTANVTQGSTATTDCASVEGNSCSSCGHIHAPFGWGRVSYCPTAQLTCGSFHAGLYPQWNK